MKIAHFIEMRVFSKEEDNEELIKEKVRKIFPFDKLKIEESTVIGFEDKKIRILKVTITKNSEINKAISGIMDKIPNEQKKLILSQVDSRLDNNLHFYFRLDKDKMLEDLFEVVDHGNCFHFKISVATYPHNRNIAKEIITKILEN